MKTGGTDLNPAERKFFLSYPTSQGFLITNVESLGWMSGEETTHKFVKQSGVDHRYCSCCQRAYLNRERTQITFVDYECLYFIPALANLLPIFGPVSNRLHVHFQIPISQPNAGPGVKCGTTDVHCGHTGRGSDCHVSFATPTSPADDLPQ